MAFKNAQQSRIIVGQTSFSAYTRDVSAPSSTEMLEVTTIADTAKVFIPGQTDASFQLGLYLDTDTTTNGEWSRLTTWESAAPLPITFAPEGVTALSPVWLVNALEAQFSMSSAVSGVVEAGVSAQADGGVDFGISLEDGLTAITVDGNGTARNLTAASSNGGVAHLHVTSFSGLTNNIVTIEHSVDGSTSWATLVTFATYTGVTSERVVVAPGTSVRQFLRVVDNVTGTGSTTRQVSFARR